MAMLPAPTRAKLQRPVERAHTTFGTDMPQRPGDFGIEVVNGMAWLVRAHEADETRKTTRRAPQIQKTIAINDAVNADGRVLDAEKFKLTEFSAADELFLQRLMPADALRIRGRHNAVNALAALALTQAAGCALGPALYALREYRGEPHRVESVAIVHDVEYFDDSKGTNVGATVAALKGLGEGFAGQRRLWVIAGGDGKGQDFSPLAAPFAQYVRGAVLIGRDAPQLHAALAVTGVELALATTLPEAVQWCSARSQSGDAVLMSPACASLDMFDHYKHRAEVFCDAVRALALDAGQILDDSGSGGTA
jgi:UDP-N-acetylmuramoylalanine--D-glutamate ligase